MGYFLVKLVINNNKGDVFLEVLKFDDVFVLVIFNVIKVLEIFDV